MSAKPQCNVCGAWERFKDLGVHPRENFACASCKCTSRDRMLIHSLAMCLGYVGPLVDWDPDPSLVVLETSGYRAHPQFLKCKFRYLNLIFADVANECLLGDVARLPLGDETVDVVISSDVFEHVREDVHGFSEIRRVLRSGGYFILQAPAIGELETTRVLVETRGG